MTISAKMILDSVSPARIRIKSMQLRYPKFIHPELMTHRAFSRNASSSRAVPTAKLIEDARIDTAMPPKWFANQPGMQGGEEIIGEGRDRLIELWMQARDNAIDIACKLHIAGAHKQHVNRVLEPFTHINVLVTSTDWANWDALRDHPGAQPEIRELAQRITEASDASTPGLLRPGQWHLPYVTLDDWMEVSEGRESWTAEHIKSLMKISVARCARVSYLTQDSKAPVIEKDIALFEKLVGSVPLHASPAEHQATPDQNIGNEETGYRWERPTWHGNLRGWIQFRKTLPNECAYDAPYILPEPTINPDLEPASEQSSSEG